MTSKKTDNTAAPADANSGAKSLEDSLSELLGASAPVSAQNSKSKVVMSDDPLPMDEVENILNSSDEGTTPRSTSSGFVDGTAGGPSPSAVPQPPLQGATIPILEGGSYTPTEGDIGKSFSVTAGPLAAPHAEDPADAPTKKRSRAKSVPTTGNPATVKQEDVKSDAPSNGTSIENAVKYRSRVEIVNAWQYTGSVKDAPSWVDRNWVGYSDQYDVLRGLEPGPCLRVPTYRGEIAIARPGDYLAIQNVEGEAGTSERLDVWPGSMFEKLFIEE